MRREASETKNNMVLFFTYDNSPDVAKENDYDYFCSA
jgi:hypothetical protein